MEKKNDTSSTETSLESLGALLRQQREQQNGSLQDFAERLKIRYRYLDALEQGRPDDLPGDVFYINFIKSYANTLALDGENFASKAREALKKKGRLKELESVVLHRQRKPFSQDTSRKNTSVALKANLVSAKLASRVAMEGEGGATSSAFVAPMPFSTKKSFPSQPIADPAIEKQLLRETLLSPLFITGGLIAVVLLYLGWVIVSDLLDENMVESSEQTVSSDIEEEAAAEESALEVIEETRAPRIYGAGSTRIELWAKETCWVAIFATDISLGKREQTEMLFAETLLEGDLYRVPAELGIVMKSGNLACVAFVVQGVVVDPFRINNPSGFMSLEPSHLRNRTAVREGGVLARERLPVVLEIELLRQQRAERLIELEEENP